MRIDEETTFWPRAGELAAEGHTAVAMRLIVNGLSHLRTALPAADWKQFCQDPAIQPMREFAHADPYTRRGFLKPRGYAGDAVLLDYIYGSAPLPDDTTPLGRSMYQWIRAESRGFESVCWRRDHFAALIDETAARESSVRVAAIACGHFREGPRSRAVANRRMSRVVALDQDAASVAIVKADRSANGVEPVCGSVRDLIAGRVVLREFDLVYAAGLFDYLGQSLARRVAATLFAALRPGGRLVIAQFERMHESAWMEALMDWWRVYRDTARVIAFADEIEPRQIASLRTYKDPQDSVIYLELNRA